MTTPDYLHRAYDAWLSAAPIRNARSRQKRYTYGDQWSDIVDDPTLGLITERQSIIKGGKRPHTNNLIRRLVKSIVGRYRAISAEAAVYDNSPDSLDSRNSMAELDCRMLEEFVISGCAIQRICSERRTAGAGVWVDNVSPDNFFVNDFRDPRGHDINLVGMLHDMTLPEIINRFSHGSRTAALRLKHIFDNPAIEPGISAVTPSGIDFFTPRSGLHRVIEVWSLDAKESSRNPAALRMVWHCRWYAPDGSLIDEYDSPFRHECHPFVVKFYPLTDGEVHSFVEDVIDQQRTVNRLVVLIDTMLATSAKGALLFPIDQLPRGITLTDISNQWAKPDAVIPITGRGERMPQQVVSNSSDSGAYQLLNLQMKLLDEISGISDAFLGRNVSPSTGAELYQAQVRNATITLQDLLDTFSAFTCERSRKAALT